MCVCVSEFSILYKYFIVRCEWAVGSRTIPTLFLLYTQCQALYCTSMCACVEKGLNTMCRRDEFFFGTAVVVVLLLQLIEH